MRYIGDDSDDERSHAELINAYLKSIGEQPINLHQFRTLPSVKAPGADQRRRRLTNLTNLTVDTSWYLRYRSSRNPDSGAKFPQLVDIVESPDGAHLAVEALPREGHAGDRAQRRVPLRGDRAGRQQPVHQPDLAGHAPRRADHPGVDLADRGLPLLRVPQVAGGLFGLRANGLDFPDLKNNRNLSEAIFLEPTQFLRKDLPLTSVIRPRNTENAGAVAAATGLVKSGLFEGQPKAFLDAVVALAEAADAAVRGV